MSRLIFLLCASCFLAACAASVPARDDSAVVEAPPRPIEDLWTEEGPDDAEVVLVVLQGGPSFRLGFAEERRSIYRYLPDYANWRAIHLHQAQTLDPSVRARGTAFTQPEAEAAVHATAQMVDRVVDHFKAEGRTVIVVGHSYGAFVLLNALAETDIDADRYVLSAGRLDQNPQMVSDHLSGLNSEYGEDGVTYTRAMPGDVPESPEERGDYHVRQLLKGAIGAPRYTEALAGRDLSGLVVFYARNDRNVGALAASEVAFLEGAGASVFETEDGHGETVLRFIDAVVDGRVTLP